MERPVSVTQVPDSNKTKSKQNQTQKTEPVVVSHDFNPSTWWEWWPKPLILKHLGGQGGISGFEATLGSRTARASQRSPVSNNQPTTNEQTARRETERKKKLLMISVFFKIYVEASNLKITVWELERWLLFQDWLDFQCLHVGSQLFRQPLPVSIVTGHTGGTDIHSGYTHKVIKTVSSLEAEEMAR